MVERNQNMILILISYCVFMFYSLDKFNIILQISLEALPS